MVFNANAFANGWTANDLMSAASESINNSLQRTLTKNSVMAWESTFNNDGVDIISVNDSNYRDNSDNNTNFRFAFNPFFTITTNN